MKLIYTIDREIGKIELSHPPQNRLISPVFEDYNRLNNFIFSEELKGIIITGQGRHFSGGADIEKLKEQIKNRRQFLEELNRAKELLSLIRRAPVPVTAVIRGSCLGAGLEIALACTFRFASDNALIGFPETDHGIMPGLGGCALAKNYISRQALVELVMTGRMISADEALSLGLVDRVFPVRKVETEAVLFIRRLAIDKERHLINSVMNSINNGLSLNREEALIKESNIFFQLAQKAFGEGTEKINE